MALLVLLPVLACPLLALATAILRRRILSRYAVVAAAVVVLGAGLALVGRTLDGDVPTALDGLLRVDALSAFMLTVIGSVGLTAAWGALDPLRPRDHLYSVLALLFLGAMSLAVLADNLGVMWVAVEATTIATAFMVGYHRTRRALEAAWKYVVLGSVGVAIAFLGIVLLYAATRAAGVPTLSWSVLTTATLDLDPSVVRVAAALAILGFATKAGLAPMHSWLPDAHSQAPAPVSGLMSGVLLAVAFYAILRVQAVASPVIGVEMMRGMLATAGLLSLTVAALLVIRQRDLKRMLAYSSIEHMGLLALAAAAGGRLAMTGALLHVLGHGLAKSSTFVASGRILAAEGTTALTDLRGLLARRPGVAVPFLVGVVALLGLPPFSLFFSEVAIVVGGFQRGLGWVMAVGVLMLLVMFIAMSCHVAAMLFGARPADETRDEPLTDPAPYGPRLPLVLALAATGVVGFVAGPFSTLLTRAASVLGGS